MLAITASRTAEIVEDIYFMISTGCTHAEMIAARVDDIPSALDLLPFLTKANRLDLLDRMVGVPAQPVAEEDTRRCVTCGLDRPLSAFGVRRSTGLPRSGSCRECRTRAERAGYARRTAAKVNS